MSEMTVPKAEYERMKQHYIERTARLTERRTLLEGLVRDAFSFVSAANAALDAVDPSFDLPAAERVERATKALSKKLPLMQDDEGVRELARAALAAAGEGEREETAAHWD